MTFYLVDKMPAANSIFISYRRSDSSDATGRISDRLIKRFGKEAVFQDVDSIPYGVDFTTHLERTVGRAHVVIAVIGPTWLETLTQRLGQSEKDWVRAEIEMALARGIDIIPVLAGNAQMPKAEALPETLKPMALLNAALARANPDFHIDMNRLILRLETLLDEQAVAPAEGDRSTESEQYLSLTTSRIERKGSLGLRQNIVLGDLRFSRVLKILDFEPGWGMRGEALFIFSEFERMNWQNVQQFSARALEWARDDVNPKAAGQAFSNVRMPTHLCFAIALVNQLDQETRQAIATTNPIKHRADLLWYEVPVVYEVSTRRLHYYAKAANFFENFRGEIVWRKLRAIIEELLAPGQTEETAANA